MPYGILDVTVIDFGDVIREPVACAYCGTSWPDDPPTHCESCGAPRRDRR